MSIHGILVSVCLLGVAGLWLLGDLTTEAVAIILLILVIAEALATNLALYRHQRALEWFAQHVKLDPRNVPAGVPKDLQELVGKEDSSPKH